MVYKYFIFDWDGSLGDTLPLWFVTFKETFAEYGLVPSDEDIAYKVLGDWQGPAKMGVVDVDGFFLKIENKLLSKLPYVKLNPGVRELISLIKERGGKIAIATASKRDYVEPALKNLGIWKDIDVMLGKEDVKHEKPDPEIIVTALKRMEGSYDSALMIGDSYKDIEAAKNAGIKSVLYFPNKYEEIYSSKKQLSLGADYVIERFEELEKLL